MSPKSTQKDIKLSFHDGIFHQRITDCFSFWSVLFAGKKQFSYWKFSWLKWTWVNSYAVLLRLFVGVGWGFTLCANECFTLRDPKGSQHAYHLESHWLCVLFSPNSIRFCRNMASDCANSTDIEARLSSLESVIADTESKYGDLGTSIDSAWTRLFQVLSAKDEFYCRALISVIGKQHISKNVQSVKMWFMQFEFLSPPASTPHLCGLPFLFNDHSNNFFAIFLATELSKNFVLPHLLCLVLSCISQKTRSKCHSRFTIFVINA